jgi:serine/threonine protein phosphatase PrpC
VIWKSITRSVIGTSHRQQQLPCQDYGCDRILNEVIVGAVADGAGSAKHADIGAKLAVTSAIECLASTEEWLQHEQKTSWQLLSKAPSQEQVHKLFLKTVTQVRETLKHHAFKNGLVVDDLACTLLAFLATPSWMAAMQIGDGFMVVRLKGQDYQLLFQPDKGEYANQTTFVTSATAVEEMQVRFVSGQQMFICASTDALERVAIRISDWKAFPPFFKPLEEYLMETADLNRDDRYLMQFLRSERLNERTDDDKTLLLCLYQS